LHPFAWAAKAIKYGYQVHPSFHNLFLQDKSIVYIGDNGESFNFKCKREDFQHFTHEIPLIDEYFKTDGDYDKEVVMF